MTPEPTLKQLKYLTAVADHLNFRQAARSCHISQPALSEQIRQLEDQLGIQLVERSQRRVALTETGERVVERAREVLRDVTDLVDYAIRAGKPFHFPIKLGVIPTIAPYLLPRIHGAIKAHTPELEIHLHEDQTHRLLAGLQSGQLDIALVALPIHDRGLKAEELFGEEFYLVAHKDWEGAQQKTIDPRKINGQQVLLLEEGHCLRDQALDVCNLNGARDNELFHASSLGTLIQMVASGLGITLLPAMALDAEIGRNPELRAIRFTEPRPGRTVGLAWRAKSSRDYELKILAGLIRKATQDMAAGAKE